MISLRNRMRIEDALYKYLVLFEELSLPGIGTLRLTRTHAVHDIAGRKIYPPTYTYALFAGEQTPARKLFLWVMEELGVSEVEAIRLVNEFSYDLKGSVNESNDVKWDKVGRFTMADNGNIVFESATLELLPEDPTPAEQLRDEMAGYMMPASIAEKSFSELTEPSVDENKKKDIAWQIAWILLIAAVMITGVYFSRHGFNVSSTGNKMQIKTGKMPDR